MVRALHEMSFKELLKWVDDTVFLILQAENLRQTRLSDLRQFIQLSRDMSEI